MKRVFRPVSREKYFLTRHQLKIYIWYIRLIYPWHGFWKFTDSFWMSLACDRLYFPCKSGPTCAEIFNRVE